MIKKRVQHLLGCIAVGLVLLGSIFSVVVVPAPALATGVGGQITSDTTWTKASSPYIVAGSILVNSGVTLTIQPGVTVKFDSGQSLRIDGQLVARGTETEQIVFTSSSLTPAPGDWLNILFSDTSVDATYDGSDAYVSGSILQYCTVEYCGASSSPALRVASSSPCIDHCAIRDNSSTGIQVNNGSPRLTGCDISRNAGGGISYNSSSGVISGNTITANSSSYGGGVYATGSTSMTPGPSIVISGNTITNNTASCGGGIAVYMYSSSAVMHPTISQNVIVNNRAYSGGGIYVNGSVVTVGCNEIRGNSALDTGPFIGLGGGLYAYSSSVIMSGNEVNNNSAGQEGAGLYLETIWESTISYNDITNNSVTDGAGKGGGVWLGGQSSVNSVNHNNIEANAPYDTCDASSQDSPSVDCTNNWWGTTDEATIQAHIWDWFDDASLGVVDYVPYLTGEVDITPPTTPVVTDDGASTSKNTQLHATWPASQDPDSGVAEYQYAVGTTAGGTDVLDWTSAGTATEVTKTSLGLTWGTTYYLAVKAKNGSGMWSGVGVSDGTVVADSTPPTTPVVTDDGDYIASTSQLHATWTSSDPESGITEYQYAIGTSAGGNDIVGWTSAGTNTEVMHTGLSLATGTTYYFAVKTKNGAGAWSEVGKSDGITAQAYTPPTADFSAQPTECAEGEVVSFTSLCSGGTTPLTYAWDFDNDGTADSTEQNPTHTYAIMGTYAVSLKVTDAKENSDTETKTNFITVTKTPTQEDVTDQGGTVETEGGQIAADFPAGAITGTAAVTIKQIPSSSAAAAPQGFKAGSTYFTIEVKDAGGNAVVTLSQPVTITVKYTEEDVEAAGGNPSKLVLAYYDEAVGEWQTLDTTVSTIDKTLSANTSHLSTWGVLVEAAEGNGTPFWVWIIVGFVAVAVVAGGIILSRRMAKKPVAAG